MKKLMILAAVTVMACVSQAYDIKWGAINVKTPIADDVKVSQTGIVGSGEAMASLTIQLYWVDSNGADVSIGSFSTGTGTSAGKVTVQTLGSGTDSALYTTMLADQGADWKPVYHMTATYTTADGKYTYDGTVTATVKLGDLSTKAISTTGNFATAGTWDYTAAPEPTSGLLLLLGMAGLALRRRRA